MSAEKGEPLLGSKYGAIGSGTTVEPKRDVLTSVCGFILVTEFCERLAYYGLMSVLAVLLTTVLNFGVLFTSEVMSLFSSLCYLTPLLGAYVADAILGRYRTILLFCVIYMIGLGICCITVLPNSIPGAKYLFLVALFAFVAFGAGGIKPNVVVLGADQFLITDSPQAKESFFRWFYWSINLGSTFSYVVLANLAVSPPASIPTDQAFFAVFVIIFASFVLGLLTFFLGRNRYRRLPTSGSVVAKTVKVFVEAGKQSKEGFVVVGSSMMLAPGIIFVICSYLVSHNAKQTLSVLGMATITFSVCLLSYFSRSTHWLQTARRSLVTPVQAQQMSDLNDVVRLFPFFSFMIIFWAIYGQMSTNFVFQGCQLDIRLGSSNYLLNSSSLSAFDGCIILLLIPVFEKVLFPGLARVGLRLSTLQKIGIGFMFSASSMLVAGILEVQRKKQDLYLYTPDGMPDQDHRVEYKGDKYDHCHSHCCNPYQLVGNAMINCTDALVEYGCHCLRDDDVSYLTGCTAQPMAHMSIWLQSFQYILIGISEIFTSTSSYELFYNHVPDSMKSVCQSLNLLTTSLGFMVTGGLNSVLSFWVKDNLNHAKLENIFFLLAGLMVLNILAFTYVAKNFRFDNQHLGRHSVSHHSSTSIVAPIIVVNRENN